MSKYEIFYTRAFKKSFKKHDAQAKEEIKAVITKLARDEQLEEKYCDHKLQGDRRGQRECHVRPNLLLIYRKDRSALVLECIELGAHNKLFKNY